MSYDQLAKVWVGVGGGRHYHRNNKCLLVTMDVIDYQPIDFIEIFEMSKVTTDGKRYSACPYCYTEPDILPDTLCRLKLQYDLNNDQIRG